MSNSRWKERSEQNRLQEAHTLASPEGVECGGTSRRDGSFGRKAMLPRLSASQRDASSGIPLGCRDSFCVYFLPKASSLWDDFLRMKMSQCQIGSADSSESRSYLIF